MVNLLMRFYDLDGGDIRIDGISTKDMSREEVHGLFGMVLQDTWMFEGTVRENLVYNRTGVSDETAGARLPRLRHLPLHRDAPARALTRS